MEVISPITHSKNVAIERKIPTSWLIGQYRRELNIDVSKYLDNLDEILVCRCMDSGYRFYYPFSVAGDGDFYSELEKIPWYYMDEKWEHNEALNYMSKGSKLLEIGSGRGSFLVKAMEKAELCVGLELNASAAAEAHSRGLTVLMETVETHAQSHQDFYDIVCSFQVLEHISNVSEFIRTSLVALKTGGLFIVCVPNNESFIIKENTLITNLPPHHMGLWTPNSLLGLQRYFCIETEYLQFEPLQPYHLGFGTDLLMKKFSNRRFSFIQRVIAKAARILPGPYPTIREMAELSTSAFSPYLPGHSILAVFRKVEQ